LPKPRWVPIPALLYALYHARGEAQ